MPNFTPGPWRALNFSEYASVVAEGQNVAIYVNDGKGQEYAPDTIHRWQANANLIAAAPEMYEFLRRIEAERYVDRAKLIALLDKAEGK